MNIIAEKNNKIKVDDLLEVANVKNLKKYLNMIDPESLIGGLLEALRNGMFNSEARLDSKVVSEFFALICYIWENYKGKRGGVQLSKYTIKFMFYRLGRVIVYDNSRGMETTKVFALVRKVWEALKDKEDDLRLNEDNIRSMFKVLNFAIVKGNSKGIEATEVLSLVESILKQHSLEIYSEAAMFMLDTLCLTCGIDDPSEKEMEPLLQKLDLNITDGRICPVDRYAFLSYKEVDKEDVISILKIIKERNNEKRKIKKIR